MGGASAPSKKLGSEKSFAKLTRLILVGLGFGLLVCGL
jgi:hypothetical protein